MYKGYKDTTTDLAVQDFMSKAGDLRIAKVSVIDISKEIADCEDANNIEDELIEKLDASLSRYKTAQQKLYKN